MKKLFGTDGIRGIANMNPMTIQTAMRVGQALARLCKRKNGQTRIKIVIGKDTRLSGYMLETAIASGICSMGADVLLVGPLPTPGIAFITSSMRADAGVVISASHNPYYDNGIKIFSADGFKLPDEEEEWIEWAIEKTDEGTIAPTRDEVGKAFRIDDAIGRYVVYLKGTFPRAYDLDGMKIALDCANGAAYRVAPAVFEELGAKVYPVGVTPDGMNINQDCGSLYPERIRDTVLRTGADIGISFDGDADRVVFVDHDGRILDGDKTLALCALHLKEKGMLRKNTVVATIMSNFALDKVMRGHGIQVVRANVGDRYVMEAMRKDGYNLGGEQSGHIIFLDYNSTGDGIITALQVLSVMVETGRPLSELAKVMEPFPQIMRNIPITRRIDLEENPEIRKKINKVRDSLRDRGRIVLRYSGTEPILRLMLEGESEDEIKTLADDLEMFLKEKFIQMEEES
ncbi:MAG: phosphoglucosamine mutase [Deltaproteobacteria bacterium]|nr:MAG: phosphoglucosamine mutase [Deltaproteobacteria bacterium]